MFVVVAEAMESIQKFMYFTKKKKKSSIVFNMYVNHDEKYSMAELKVG